MKRNVTNNVDGLNGKYHSRDHFIYIYNKCTDTQSCSIQIYYHDVYLLYVTTEHDLVMMDSISMWVKHS